MKSSTAGWLESTLCWSDGGWGRGEKRLVMQTTGVEKAGVQRVRTELRTTHGGTVHGGTTFRVSSGARVAALVSKLL